MICYSRCWILWYKCLVMSPVYIVRPFFRNYFVCLSFRCLRRKAALRDPEAHAAGTSGIFKRLKARSNDANRDLYTDLMCASIFLLSGVKYRSFDSDYRTHQEVTLIKESMSNLSLFFNSLSFSLSISSGAAFVAFGFLVRWLLWLWLLGFRLFFGRLASGFWFLWHWWHWWLS